MMSSASSRVSRPVLREPLDLDRRRSRRRRARRGALAASGSARRRSRARTGRAREPDVARSSSGSSVAIASRPAGARTRATSASARGRSTRCSDIRITTASNQPRLNGSASARATRALTPSAFARATISVGGVDRPDARERPLLERLREPAGAAADLEHARAAQVAELGRARRRPATSCRRPGAARRSAPRGGRSRAPVRIASVASAALGSRGRARGARAPPLTSVGLAALAERHLDRRRSRAAATVVREDLARLAQQLGAEVARRDVRQREQPHAGVARELGRLRARSSAPCRRRGRARRRRTSPRGRAGRRRRRAARHDLGRRACRRCRRSCGPARAGPTSSLGRAPSRPSASVTASPRWSAPRSGPKGTPSASAVSSSKRPGPLVLDERVADRRHAVRRPGRRSSS